MRKRETERKKIASLRGGERERGRVSRGLSVTRGVERRVTQVQSSAPACPRAILAQQRQEAAEHQWLQQRQVGWNYKQTSQRIQAMFLLLFTTISTKKQAFVFMVWDFPFSFKTRRLNWVLNSNLCCPVKSTLKLITGRCNCDKSKPQWC